MVFKDLREYIDALEREGELKRVKAEVDWDEEIGAICEESIARSGPALLFENIKDHQETHGRRVLASINLVSQVRVYMALNVSTDAHPMEAVRTLRNRCQQPIKPKLVKSGPCKESIHKGSEVNLLEFPTPKWHGKDGGRYIVTFGGGVVTKDPETDWVNIGTYRGMVLDRSSIGMLYIPTQHWAMHGAKYAQMGKSMPLAITIGSDPVSPFVFCSPFDSGVCEYDMVGAIRQQPLEVVKCETVDLEVPATSEIILEGELTLDPKGFRPEGPFGEYPGYYSKLSGEPGHVLKVNCITHRKDPILLGMYEGFAERYPWAKPCNYLECIPLWDVLVKQGIMGIHGVYGMDPFPTSHAIIAVSVSRSYFGQARQIAAALWGNSLSAQIAKYVIVVDSDVDITNPTSVFTAIANRSRPDQDVVIFPGSFGAPLDPSVAPEIVRETGGLGRWDRVLIDATWPPEWGPRKEWDGLRHPVPCTPDPKIMEQVRKRWGEYKIN